MILATHVFATFLASCASFVYTPVLFLALIFLFFGSVGSTVGVRQLYSDLLLKIFEYGRWSIKEEFRSRGRVAQWEELSEDEEEEDEEAEQNGGVTPLIIRDDDTVLVPDVDNKVEDKTRNGYKVKKFVPQRKSIENIMQFNFGDCLSYVKAGVEAIIEDDVTQRFSAAELKSWNLLTRTNHNYEFINVRLTVIWVLGFMFRYFILLPMRITITVIGVLWLTVCTAFVGIIPDGAVKRWANRIVILIGFRILCRALSAIIRFHNTENRPNNNGICVANHTSPIDVMVLAHDNVYAMVGQRHGGFLGILQRGLARASAHIWFERAEVSDRSHVARRLREHVEKPDAPPILIFPEGTCINNTSVMQFKKGSFEIGSVIYPVAIKYDARFGDAFWNSSQDSYVQYLYKMWTSWALVCDVWYLPPMMKESHETAIEFANRVKGEIARKGGLVDLVWDGMLKRKQVKKEWKEKQQEKFSQRFLNSNHINSK